MTDERQDWRTAAEAAYRAYVAESQSWGMPYDEPAWIAAVQAAASLWRTED